MKSTSGTGRPLTLLRQSSPSEDKSEYTSRTETNCPGLRLHCELCTDLHKHQYSTIVPHQHTGSLSFIEHKFVECGSYKKRTITRPLLKQIREQCHGQNIFLQAKTHKHWSQLRDLRGSCTALFLSRQLSALSLPPHGSVQVCWLQLLESSDFPPELPRAALPGLQCAGSPFPTAPSPAGPQGASAPSPVPAEQSSPGFAAPARGQQGEERSGQ